MKNKLAKINRYGSLKFISQKSFHIRSLQYKSMSLIINQFELIFPFSSVKRDFVERVKSNMIKI